MLSTWIIILVVIIIIVVLLLLFMLIRRKKQTSKEESGLSQVPEPEIQNHAEIAPINGQLRSWAPDYNDVLVVYNENSAISIQIAQYFQSQRSIPNTNMCNITTVTNEEINRATFDDIMAQVKNYITNKRRKLEKI